MEDRGESSSEDDEEEREIVKERKFALALRKRKVRDLKTALDTSNYRSLEIPNESEEKKVIGKLSKNPADNVVFTNREPSTGKTITV